MIPVGRPKWVSRTTGIADLFTVASWKQDESLYATFLGSDFVDEGKKAGQWLVDNASGDGTVEHVRERFDRPADASMICATSRGVPRPSSRRPWRTRRGSGRPS